jgi:sterol desaturase/sphingolipid hydroxylase (fatty acid hydroxylase superfamily)
MGPTWTSLLIGFLVVGAICVTLERLWPSVRGKRFFRAGFLTDLTYWAFTPVVTRAITRAALIVVIVPVALLAGRRPETLAAGFGPLGRQPLWLQAIEMLVLADFIGYWTHRAFHRGRLWRFHAVHHSSTELDWLSAVRVHPVNDALSRLASAVPLVAVGFAPVALAAVAPILTVWAILLHANLTWDLGPLRRVIASPVFHRWHHTSAAEGRDKNFAGLLPLWDILFGTYCMPRHAPTRFGVDDAVPAHLAGQLIWPFRRA